MRLPKSIMSLEYINLLLILYVNSKKNSSNLNCISMMILKYYKATDMFLFLNVAQSCFAIVYLNCKFYHGFMLSVKDFYEGENN